VTSPYPYNGANGEYEFKYPAAGDELPKPGLCLILTEGGVCRTGNWQQGDLGWAGLPSRNREKEERINAVKRATSGAAGAAGRDEQGGES
jgi:hypothetical protein